MMLKFANLLVHPGCFILGEENPEKWLSPLQWLPQTKFYSFWLGFTSVSAAEEVLECCHSCRSAAQQQ